MKHLLIVESPAKRKTIGRYLQDFEGTYDIEASIGHIRDLATKGKEGLGVDVEAGFIPTYEVNKDKREVVNKLKKAVKQVDEVILATDPDREGEAIAWHLAQVLDLDVKKTKRIEFHEITRESIKNAMNNPRTINLDMKASQETRRILDRLSGFKLSKLLQQKIKSRSAGRVQSVTLKILVERENEIKSFIAEEYWTVNLTLEHQPQPLIINLVKVDQKKVNLKSEQETNDALAKLGKQITLTDVKVVKKNRQPRFPFTTSTLQQDAFSRLRFATKKTSSIASQLYEGIKIGAEEVGLITYMRTDSVRLSDTYTQRARNYIKEAYGDKYLGTIKKVKVAGLVQDAHEAIRPTANHRTPESIKQYLTDDQFKLYQLIYNRALASLMADKIEQVTTYTFIEQNLEFALEGTVILFDGFATLYPNNDEEEKAPLPNLEVKTKFNILDVEKKQNFTKPPSRYSEARIVEEMEKHGIGRPSTYSATIDTLKARNYVTVKGGILTPTNQGECTVKYLDKFFPDFMNISFTANLEKQLDEIKDGNNSSIDILSGFYQGLVASIDEAKSIPVPESCLPDHGSCPQCQIGRLVERKSKFGRFIGCSRYPDCHYIKKEPKQEPIKVNRNCPKCGSPLYQYVSKKNGKPYIACSNFKSCKYFEKVAKTAE